MIDILDEMIYEAPARLLYLHVYHVTSMIASQALTPHFMVRSTPKL